jgi:glycine hydroxymethyltransferase
MTVPTVPATHPGVEQVLRAVSAHGSYRADCVGLVPTENRTSPLARQVLASDLGHRYLFQNPQWRYVGGKHLAEIEATAKRLACETFGAEHANVRPLSGENCTNIVIHALVEPGDVFYHLAMEDGGHFAAASVAERITSNRRLLPYDAERAELDMDGCARAFADTPPDVIYLDASMVLYPHRLQDLRTLAGPRATIVYDASQVFGLLAGGVFQNPLAEGADVLSGSTHKSLPGPQKGMILTRRRDLMDRIEEAIFPGHVSNFHLHHVAALAVTLAEAQAFGADYGRWTIDNARVLADELAALGLAVQGGAPHHAWRTDSHQVWLDVTGLATADEAVERLHAANLIANVNLIPTLRAKGLRLGTPEATRLGMGVSEMRELAGLIHATLSGSEALSGVRRRTTRLARRFQGVRYCFQAA